MARRIPGEPWKSGALHALLTFPYPNPNITLCNFLSFLFHFSNRTSHILLVLLLFSTKCDASAGLVPRLLCFFVSPTICALPPQSDRQGHPQRVPETLCETDYECLMLDSAAICRWGTSLSCTDDAWWYQRRFSPATLSTEQGLINPLSVCY